MYKLLSSAGNRTKVVNTLVNAVQTQSWDGVDVDLESLHVVTAPAWSLS